MRRRDSALPVAIVCEGASRRDGRQRWRLEGWRDAISAGRYDYVQFDCINESIAKWLEHLAAKVSGSGSAFNVVVQMAAEEIATLSPAAQTIESANQEPEPLSAPAPAPAPQQPVTAFRPPAPYVCEPTEPPPRVAPPADTAEEYAARKERYREIMGSYDSFEAEKPRRRWLR